MGRKPEDIIMVIQNIQNTVKNEKYTFVQTIIVHTTDLMR